MGPDERVQLLLDAKREYDGPEKDNAANAGFYDRSPTRSRSGSSHLAASASWTSRR